MSKKKSHFITLAQQMQIADHLKKMKVKPTTYDEVVKLCKDELNIEVTSANIRTICRAIGMTFKNYPKRDVPKVSVADFKMVVECLIILTDPPETLNRNWLIDQLEKIRDKLTV